MLVSVTHWVGNTCKTWCKLCCWIHHGAVIRFSEFNLQWPEMTIDLRFLYTLMCESSYQVWKSHELCFSSYHVHYVFRPWPLLTKSDLWHMNKQYGSSESASHVLTQTQALQWKFSCWETFQILLVSDYRWPKTSMTSNRVLLHNMMNPSTKYEINPWTSNALLSCHDHESRISHTFEYIDTVHTN